MFLWGFEEKKRSVVSVFGGMFNLFYVENNFVLGVLDIVVLIIEYVVDFIEKFRNFNQNDIKFEILYNQLKVFEKMVMDEDINYVIYGIIENFQYVVVEDDFLIEDVWEDRNGEYDDFNQFFRDNLEYSMSMDDVDILLEGEEMDDFSQ